MNFLFFEHPNGRERVNLAFYYCIELVEKRILKDKKEYTIYFYRDLATSDGKQTVWRFYDEDEARDTFMAIADVMRDYLYAAVLPDFIITKDCVEYVNVSPSEDGWSLFVHVRVGDSDDVFSFPAESEEEAMNLYKAFIVA